MTPIGLFCHLDLIVCSLQPFHLLKEQTKDKMMENFMNTQAIIYLTTFKLNFNSFEKKLLVFPKIQSFRK